MVRKISTRSTQKIQIRTDVTWCCSSPSHKLSSTSESTPPSISISSSDYFGGVGSGLPCTRSHNKIRSFFLTGVAPLALKIFQLINFFRSAQTTCPLLLTRSRWVSHWSAASFTCTIVRYFYIPSWLTHADSFLSLCTSRMIWTSLEEPLRKIAPQVTCL